MRTELDRLRTFLCDPESIYDIRLLFYLSENFCQLNIKTRKIYCIACEIEFDTVHDAIKNIKYEHKFLRKMKSTQQNRAIAFLSELPYTLRSQILFTVTDPGFDFQTNEVGKILRDDLRGYVIQQAIEVAFDPIEYGFDPQTEFEIFLETPANYGLYVSALLLDYGVDNVQNLIKEKLANSIEIGEKHDFIAECKEKLETDENGNDTKMAKLSRMKRNKELERLKVDFECQICFRDQISILYEPCLHFIACNNCAFRSKTCFVCHKPVFRRKLNL